MTPPRTATPLLLLILVVVLLQPIVLVLLLDREETERSTSTDPRLIAALENLTETLSQRETGARPPLTTPALPPRGDRRERPTGRAATIGDPVKDRAPPMVAEQFPRRQERIDAWIQRLSEAEHRGEEATTMHFFHLTMDEVLGQFGVPDAANDVGGDVRWIYHGADDRGELYIDFVDGRVFHSFYTR